MFFNDPLSFLQHKFCTFSSATSKVLRIAKLLCVCLFNTAAGNEVSDCWSCFNPSSRLCWLPTLGMQPRKEIYRKKTCQRTALLTNTNTPHQTELLCGDKNKCSCQATSYSSLSAWQSFHRKGSSVPTNPPISTAMMP